MSSKTLLKKAGYTTVTRQPYPKWNGNIVPISDHLPRLQRIAADLEVDLPHQEPWKDGEHRRKIRLSKDVEVEVQSHYDDSVWIDVANWKHGMFFFKDTYYTSWAGSSSLASKKPFVPSVVKEISEVKEKELEAAQEKRRHTIKNNMDAVRLLLEKNNIECSRVAGAVRIHADMSNSIDFVECKNSTRIKVVFSYRPGEYVQNRDITTLDLANPNFEELALIIIHNFSNMWKIVTGERQLKPMPFKVKQK